MTIDLVTGDVMLISKDELASILYINGITFDPYSFNKMHRFNRDSVPICLICDDKGEVYICTISTEVAANNNEYHFYRAGHSTIKQVSSRKKINFEDTVIVIGGYIPVNRDEYHSARPVITSLQGCKNMIGVNELLKSLTKREKELRLRCVELIDNITVLLNDRLLQR